MCLLRTMALWEKRDRWRELRCCRKSSRGHRGFLSYLNRSVELAQASYDFEDAFWMLGLHISLFLTARLSSLLLLPCPELIALAAPAS